MNVRLDQITEELDTFFRIDGLPPDSPFSRLVPQVYEETGVELGRYLQQSFLEAFHGLMVHNGQSVSQIYLTVFLSEEILTRFLLGAKETYSSSPTIPW